ncbi:MAG: UvrD-helicase domain-containing protein, partial [Gaiellales bacterium]
MTLAPNTEQLAAIGESGVVFVSAGAGTGKTTVLVERFARAVIDRGVPADSLLVITYTERAAGELRARIRGRFSELDRHDLALEVDRAWISTIHGFCSRVLRAHPFEAGLDPRFRVLDDNQARILRSEAFDEALAAFCRGREEERLRLLATYGARDLKRMLGSVFERLRSAGRKLALAAEPGADLEGALDELREQAAGVIANGEGGRTAELLSELLDGQPRVDDLLDLSELTDTRDDGSVALIDAASRVENAALELIAARDRTLLEVLLADFDARYRTLKGRESAVDFEDLQLITRELLQRDQPVREALAWRFRSIMVDEFQDTNRLQCELIDLIAGDELFFVGDEFQSIYRFRHADVEVFRERRAQSGGVLALTQNYRSRPEVLGVVNHIFRSEFGEDFAPLTAAGRFPDPAFGPAVEVLVTDRSAYRARDESWRRAEAESVAARVAGLDVSTQADALRE